MAEFKTVDFLKPNDRYNPTTFRYLQADASYTIFVLKSTPRQRETTPILAGLLAHGLHVLSTFPRFQISHNLDILFYQIIDINSQWYNRLKHSRLQLRGQLHQQQILLFAF